MTDQNNAAPDLGTSSGGRAYIAEYFATQLRRHDFARYINNTLAADFACALAQHLSKLRAEGVQAGDEREALTHQDIYDRFSFLEGLVSAYTYEEIAEAAIAIYESGAPWPNMADTIRDLRAELGYVAQYGERVLPNMCPPATSRDRWMYEQGRLAERAALASAPVAGEADNTDYIGLALELEGAAKRVESQTVQRAIEAGAHGLRLAYSFRNAAPQASEVVPKPIAVARHSDQSVLLAFSSCRLASVFERTIQPQIDQAHKDLIAHGVSIQRIAPADFLAPQADKDGGDCAPHNSDSRYAVESSTCGDCAKGAGDELAWQRLTDSERDGFVGELVDYGTDFVSPLYSVVESIERRLREKNATLAAQKQGDSDGDQ